MGGIETTPVATAAPAAAAYAADARRDHRLRAVSAILGEAETTKGSAGPVSGAGSDGGLGRLGCGGRRQASHAAEEIGVR